MNFLGVQLGLNTSGFKQALDQAKMQAKGFASSITHEVGHSWGSLGKGLASGIAGMFTVEAFKGLIENIVQTASHLREMSEQLDTSTDDWQRWEKAVSKAGLSVGGFMAVFEKLRQTREDAKNGDVGARGKLSKLGFSDDDIISTKLGESEFARRALMAGTKDRSALIDIVGNRGAKYISAAKEFKPNSEVTFNANEVEELHAQEEFFKGLWKSVTKNFVRAVRNIREGDTHEATAASPDMEWLQIKKTMSPQYKNAVNERSKKHAEESAQSEIESDRFDAVLKKQREEQDRKREDEMESLRAAQRAAMPEDERRKSLEEEVELRKNKIAELEDKMHGADNEPELSDEDQKRLKDITGKSREYELNKIRDEMENRLIAEQTKLQGLENQLKKEKSPDSFSADSLASVGLFTTSTVQFNPMLNIAQETLNTLREISGKLPGPTSGNRP
ncbi:MAG: hypothetical protein WCO56_26565 [Verrucomicrobiota bacterium]